MDDIQPARDAGRELAIEVRGVSHAYGQRRALHDVSLKIAASQIFCLLGPNGGGKSTLFRLLATLIPLQQGELSLLGYDARRMVDPIRRRLGVVFQSPSVDRKLTVWENVWQQAALYGLTGAAARSRGEHLLRELGLWDRRTEFVETLSGGLRRRVELAKGMIHQPQLLVMDEPSTGLDPGARSDLWVFLRRLQAEFGTTIALTTHLLDEAERADQLAILDQGKIVATGTASELRGALGGDCITLTSADARKLAQDVQQRFQLATQVVDQTVRIEVPQGHKWLMQLVDAFPDQVVTATLGKPTLEDVFIAKTGHRFWSQEGVVA